MTVRLGAPAMVAGLAVVLALAACPDLPLLGLHPAAGGVVAALAALFVIALLDRRAPRRLLALGAATVALAVGYDALRGQRGTFTLGEGQGTQNFDEVGPGGRVLGYRPLPATLALDDVLADGTAVLAREDAAPPLRVSPGRAVSVGGYRVGEPRRVPGPGTRVVLRVAGGASGEAALREGEKARIGDLDVTLQQYFPDFAVENNQPFSRSDQPRNPAALLRVERGTASWRAFVIRALPGIHRPEGLDRTLTLVDVVPDEAMRLAVSREPAALLAALGLVVAAVGVAWSRW